MIEMCVSQMGQDPEIRSDARLQSGHFAGLRNPSFNDRHFMLTSQIAQCQRHTHLAIEAARAAKYVVRWQQELNKPFFDSCFSVAAGNRDGGCGTGIAPAPNELLP